MATPEQQADFQTQMQSLLSQVFKCACHPGKPNPYSGAHDMHPKRFIALDGREAEIDHGIADLIWELWRFGSWTLGSCQEFTHGDAYVQFAARGVGADQLVFVATQLQIPTQVSVDANGAHIGMNSNGGRIGDISLESVTVRFPPSTIPRLVIAFRQGNDRANRHGRGGPPPV